MLVSSTTFLLYILLKLFIFHYTYMHLFSIYHKADMVLLVGTIISK